MKIRPIELKDANKFVVKNHRHHKEVQGHKFSLGCFNDDKLLGVVTVGRPVSRHMDNGLTLEVTRLCTDGSKNVCSSLYSASARVAKEMGYDSIITYILESETGLSLRASGWELDKAVTGGKHWTGHKESGGRTDTVTNLFGETKKYSNEMKQRWVKRLSKNV